MHIEVARWVYASGDLVSKEMGGSRVEINKHVVGEFETGAKGVFYFGTLTEVDEVIDVEARGGTLGMREPVNTHGSLGEGEDPCQ